MMNLIAHSTNIHIKNVLLHQIHTGILALVYTNMIKYTLVKFYFFTGEMDYDVQGKTVFQIYQKQDALVGIAGSSAYCS